MGEIRNLQFDFQPFEQSHRSKRLTGITMTIYKTHVGLTADLMKMLGNPKNVTVGYIKSLDMIGIIADENGTPVNSSSSSKFQIAGTAIREFMKKRCGFDADKYIGRLTKGIRAGDYVVFSIDDLELVERKEK